MGADPGAVLVEGDSLTFPILRPLPTPCPWPVLPAAPFLTLALTAASCLSLWPQRQWDLVGEAFPDTTSSRGGSSPRVPTMFWHLHLRCHSLFLRLPCISQLSARNKTPPPGGFNNVNLLPVVLEVVKSEVTMPANLVPGESSVCDLHTAPSCCVFIWPQACARRLSSSSYEAPAPRIRDPPS